MGIRKDNINISLYTSWVLLIFCVNVRFVNGLLMDQALRKDARQSSTFRDYSAKKAVDGKGRIKCLLRQGSVSCTESEESPWIQVNLKDPVKLSRIEVTSRDGNSDNYNYLGQFVLLVGNNSDITTYIRCGSNSATLGNGKTGYLGCKQVASWVALRKITGNSGSRLCICDLKAMGTKICPSGRYGTDCTKKCPGCKNGACESVSGSCIRGCNPGKLGDRCTLNCVPGFYGDGCKYSCPKNCDTVCQTESGACRCKPGYTGLKCDLPCPSGFYGQDCNSKCSETCEGGLCSFEDGFCPNCIPGYKGDNCLEQCDKGYYGKKCSLPCPDACPFTCHRTTGVCLKITKTTTTNSKTTNDTTITTPPAMLLSSTRKETFKPTLPQTSEEYRNAAGDLSTQHTTGGLGFVTRNTATPTTKKELVDKKQDDGVPLVAIIIPLVVILVALSIAMLVYVLFRLKTIDERKRMKHHKAVTEIEDKSYHANKLPAHSKEQKSLFTGFRYYDTEDDDMDKLSLEMNMNVETQTKLDVINEDSKEDIGVDSTRNSRFDNAIYYQDGDNESDKISLELNMADFSKEHAKSQAAEQDNEVTEIALDNDITIEDQLESDIASYGNDSTNLGEGIYDSVGYPVKVDELLSKVLIMKDEDDFVQQFNRLSKGKQADWETGCKDEVKHMNEFDNIIPYDHNRVILETIGDDPDTDYINASYVSGFDDQKHFIAAQGPTRNSVEFFVRMLWERDIPVVVSLINLDHADVFVKFWPSMDETELYFGDVKVEMIKEDIRAHYITRTIMLARNNLFKEVHICEFTKWTETDVAFDVGALLRFHDDVAVRTLMAPEDAGPVLVHCNTGSSRTGVYIVLDYLIEQAHDEKVIDVVAAVDRMRESRIGMVPTIEQFTFLYEVLLEALYCGKTSTAATEFLSFLASLTESKDDDNTDYLLVRQHNVLDIMTSNFSTSDCIGSFMEENKDKNRTDDVLAPEKYRPELLTEVLNSSSYINAVYVEGYNSKHKFPFIATQSPMQNTQVDFWRLVHDYGIRSIVALNSFDEDEDFPEYWSGDLGETIPLRTHLTEEETVRNSDNRVQYTVRSIETHFKEDQALTVKQFQICGWRDDEKVPRNSENLLALMRAVQDWQEESGDRQILVHCQDGASHCGVYCAISSIISRLSSQKEVDIFHAVRQARHSRPQFIRSFEQYQFLHHAAADFINTYSNLATNKRITVADAW